jgi:hypothetical protein
MPARPHPSASRSRGRRLVEGAKKIGKGVEVTAKGIFKTVTEGAKEVGHRAEDTGRASLTSRGGPRGPARA